MQIGYDEGLAHLIQGGCDALLMPSRFEPCGLTQLCAMRYGALPVVAHVGGLCDTVIDANEMALAAGIGTGFHFAPVHERDAGCGDPARLSVWRQPDVWRRLQRNAMQTDVSWRRPAARYAALYREHWRRESDGGMEDGSRCSSSGTTRTGDSLFDQLRRDGLDEPGVSRDPYGPGEQRAHATVAAAARQLGLRHRSMTQRPICT